MIDHADTFERVDFGEAYESAVLSYPWVFWQFIGNQETCAALPDPSVASDEELAGALYPVADAFGVFTLSDGWLNGFYAYYYEVQELTGWPALPNREAFEEAGLIRENLIDIEKGIVPEGVTPPEFDTEGNELLRELANTLDDVIHLYGQSDPWAAAAAQPTAGSGGRSLQTSTMATTASASTASKAPSERPRGIRCGSGSRSRSEQGARARSLVSPDRT